VTVFFYGLADARTLEEFAAAGAVRCVFWLTSTDHAVVEDELEQMRRSIGEFTGSAL
jgi:hypothetical protein